MRTMVLSLPPGALQDIKRKINKKETILTMGLFMNIGFWLIMFCDSESKDI